MDSILNSIKKRLGIEPNDSNFDDELILHINSVFGICYQLGVGPKDMPFRITNADNTWDEFMVGNQIDTVQDYIFAKVKIIFDSSTTSSFVLAAYQDLAKEFEWRCYVDAETP